jgi:hypothetical protein
VLELSSSSCPPGLDYNPSGRKHCAERNRNVLDFLLANPQIDTVALVAYRDRDSNAYLDKIFLGFAQAIVELKAAGKTIVLVYPTPRDRVSVPQRLAAEQLHFGKFRSTISTLKTFENRLKNTFARLDSLAETYGLVVVRPSDVYCPNDRCETYLGGQVLFFDRHHPSLSGARLLAPLFADVIARSGAR